MDASAWLLAGLRLGAGGRTGAMDPYPAVPQADLVPEPTPTGLRLPVMADRWTSDADQRDSGCGPAVADPVHPVVVRTGAVRIRSARTAGAAVAARPYARRRS